MLPGKLCIGILEEDNPLKSYFRLKPLLVESEGKYVPFDGGDSYPEEGCIRIVPDKNESSHFKGRMRRMGRYCVLDLRDHAGENDKIRPNKNYHGDESEKNAHIVYSDVVREPAEDMIFEILPEGDWNGEAPGTPRVVKADGLETWAYSCAEAADEAASLSLDGGTLAEEEIQKFEIAGFSGEMLHFAIRLPGVMPSVIGVPAPRAEAGVRAPVAVKPVEKPVEEAPPQAEVAPEKPWISHDMPKTPVVFNEDMSPMQQALAAQSGLNPRRNRSLQEIIEEKWRHSRVDQLGHPVPAEAMGCPVENPLEKALDALRGAWRIPELQERLMNAVAEMPEFASGLNARRKDLAETALQRELEDLEAERLKTLNDIDHLRREKAALRETFKNEIRRDEAVALRDAVEKTRAAQQELEKYEKAASEARKAAEFAQDAFAALNDGRFEEKLRDFALTSRAVELLTHPEKQVAPCPVASDEKPSREEWIARLQRAALAEGLELNEIQAANLLVCAALGGCLMISGAASSDKDAAGRALARALGAMDSGCYVETSACASRDSKENQEQKNSELPMVALVRNANNRIGADITCGLLDGRENGIVVSILSNGGCPVAAEELDRGFLLCMEPASLQRPWKMEHSAAGVFSPVRLSALREAFMSREELPAALERRLQKLREALAMYGVRLSRRTLDMMWHYCAAMLALGKISPAEALDMAFAQKALPCILAEAPVECLASLKNMLSGMPHSLALLDMPLPIFI